MLLPEAATNQSQELRTPVAMAMALQYAKKLDFVETINRSAAWDEKQCNLSPGQLALSIVLSTFADVRSPLYHIKNNFAHMDTAFLFGPGVTGDDFTDDALARTLDKIYAAGSSRLFSKIALNGYKVKDDALHACYEGQEFQETIQIVDAEKNTHALTVRLFVYRSNENTLRIEKRLKKEEERLQADKAVLEKKVFACAEDAESAAREFAGAKHRNLIDIETTVCSKTTETLGRGRIGKNPGPAKTKTLWYVRVRIIGPNEKRVRPTYGKYRGVN
ncbi:hypothetical protein SCACP_11640 [Sporomusa carbonis]